MKIVYDNIIYNLQRVGGISHYWYFLTEGLLKYNADLQFIEHIGNDNFFEKKLCISSDKKIKETQGNIWLERFKSVHLLDNNDFDIFHSSYYRTLKKKGNTKEVITLHDFIEFQDKSRFRIFHRRQIHQAITRADGIICISEKTKRELFQYYPNLGTKNIEVIYHGVDPYYKVLTNSEIFNYTDWNILLEVKGKIVLYVGDRKAKYKRFEDLVKVLSRTDYKLIIAGGGELSQKEFKLLEEHLPQRYVVNAYVSFERLNFFYNIANCLIYPSLNEGFGAPLLEAAKAGCPYIVFKNRIPQLLKTEWGIELEEFTTQKIIKAVEKCKILKEEMRQNITSDQFRSWNDTVKDTLNFYQKVLSND